MSGISYQLAHSIHDADESGRLSKTDLAIFLAARPPGGDALAR